MARTATDERDSACGEPRRRDFSVRLAQHAARTRKERSVGCAEREERRLPPKLLETNERLHVAFPIAARGHSQVVAAVFAQDAQLVRNPPHGRMVEEQGFDDRLNQVHEIVVPPHVCELVRQDRFELTRTEARQRGHRARAPEALRGR